MRHMVTGGLSLAVSQMLGLILEQWTLLIGQDLTFMQAAHWLLDVFCFWMCVNNLLLLSHIRDDLVNGTYQQAREYLFGMRDLSDFLG